MARISVKYTNGTKVQTRYKPHCEGIVTAVFIRGKGRSYEFSHAIDGEPKCCTLEECEIEPLKDNTKIGYK